MFGKKEKEPTEEQIDVLNAIYYLLSSGKIPFGALDPLTRDSYYSGLICTRIKEQKEQKEETRRHFLAEKESMVRKCKQDLKHTIHERDKSNAVLTDLRHELEEEKNKESFMRNEGHIRNLLWWIFNGEEELKELEDEIRTKESLLKKLEDEFLKETEKEEAE